jgi:hypothetical protein
VQKSNQSSINQRFLSKILNFSELSRNHFFLLSPCAKFQSSKIRVHKSQFSHNFLDSVVKNPCIVKESNMPLNGHIYEMLGLRETDLSAATKVSAGQKLCINH